jgi:molybdenum cofactor cytidylyltransferase
MNGIWAIILAAGESRRMGSPKMLLPYAGLTIIEHVIMNVLAADIVSVVTVLGAEKEEIGKLTGKYDVINCYNDDYNMGMLSSVRCGLRSLPGNCSAALVLPGDQPMITTSEINKIIAAYRTSGRGIVLPLYDGKRGHPVIIDMKYRDEVMSLPDSEGLRALAGRHHDDICEAETDDPCVLRDIDTREDYLNELNKINM